MAPICRSLAIFLTVGIVTGGLYPRPVLADEAARISRLESEIQQLRIRIDEQLRRIERLEVELSRRTGEPLIGTIPGRHEHAAGKVATERLPWHSPEPWAQVSAGMSEEQVKQILGEPTSIESLDSYKTLFYRGSIGATGTINGHVNLRDGRVVAVKKPEF